MNNTVDELNFVQKFVRGLVKEDSILDHIDLWHETTNNEVPLHEFIGLSFEEYMDFVITDSALLPILTKKKKEYMRSFFNVVK